MGRSLVIVVANDVPLGDVGQYRELNIYGLNNGELRIYTASPEEAEFVGLTAVVGTIQLYR